MRLSRVLIALLLVVVLAATATAQTAMTVKVDDVSGPHRQATEVPIEVVGATNVGSMYMELVYDATVLAPTEVKRGDLTTNSLVQPNLDETGRIKIALIDAGGFGGDGSVAVVVFDVPGQDGETSALTLENVRASDATGQPPAPIQTSVQNGTFTVGGGSSSAVLITGMVVLLLFAALGLVWFITRRSQQAAPAAAVGGYGDGRLVVQRGQTSPAALELNREVVTLGRDPSNDFVLYDDLSSRQHAQIRREAGGTVLYDLGSSNGTFVNGERVSGPRALQAGDVIAIGDTELQVQA